MLSLESPGKIDVATDKELYFFEETVKVGVRLEMKEPKKARRLKLSFYATRTSQSHGKHKSRRTEVIYSTTADLDGEREYSGVRAYASEFKIPPCSAIESALGKELVSFVGGAIGMDQGELLRKTVKLTRWHIKATLDIPMGADVNGEKQVLVRLKE